MLRHVPQGLLFVAHHANGFAPLVICQFGPAAHDDALRYGQGPTLRCALFDAVALHFCERRKQAEQRLPERATDIEGGMIEDFDFGLGFDHTAQDFQSVSIGARGAIPFGDHQAIAGGQRRKKVFELRAAL